MAKAKTKGGLKKTPKDEFVLTISDNEDNVPDYEEESEPEQEVTTKKSKKKATKTQQEDGDINPEFQFSLDGLDSVETFDGSWDFESFKDKGADAKKGVDLDEIIRQK